MNYTAFTRHIASDLDFSNLLPHASGTTDFNILKAELEFPGHFESTKVFRKNLQAEIHCTDSATFLLWPGLMLCEISDKHIAYRHLGQETEILKLFLLSEALGIALLHQGIYLLHGSAVAIRNRAHVFVGEPGVGKSTTAAAFWQQGHTILSDDLVAIQFIDNKSFVLPAYPLLKVWKIALEGLQLDFTQLRPSFEGRDKFLLPQHFDSFPKKPLPLAALNILSTEKSESIKPLAAPTELLKHFPLPHQLLLHEKLKFHFEKSIFIAKTAEIRQLKRPEGFEALKQFTSEYAN